MQIENGGCSWPRHVRLNAGWCFMGSMHWDVAFKQGCGQGLCTPMMRKNQICAVDRDRDQRSRQMQVLLTPWVYKFWLQSVVAALAEPGLWRVSGWDGSLADPGCWTTQRRAGSRHNLKCDAGMMPNVSDRPLLQGLEQRASQRCFSSTRCEVQSESRS